MGIEDRLNISISDRDAERIQTAGELLDYLIKRVDVAPVPNGAICRSARTFYRSRALIADWAKISAHSIGPSSQMEQFLPAREDVEGRRAAWSQLQDVLEIDECKLRPPAAIQTASNLILLGTLMGVVLAAIPMARTMISLGPVFVTGTGAGLFLSVWLWGKKIANEVPAELQTFGAIVGRVRLGQTQDRPRLVAERWTRPELWELIQDLAAASAGISPTKVRRDTRFQQL